MAFTVNGIGTSVCKAGNSVTWDGQESFDAVECLVVVFLPIIPFRSIHTFDWQGMQFRMLPIRWSGKMVLFAFLRRWLWGAVIVGSIFGIVGVVDFSKVPFMAPISGLVIIAASAFLFALGKGSRGRECDIRRVLGPHGAGTSDPAMWKDDMLRGVQDAKTLYGSDSYAAAVGPLLEQNRFADALWAARLCTVLEDADQGERLTEEVLDHPEVESGLDEIGDKSRLWQALFAPVPRVEMPPPEEDVVVTPVAPASDDGQIQDKGRRRDDSIRQ